MKGETQPFRWDLEAAVQRYMNDRAWRKEARAFYLYNTEHIKHELVGKDPKIKCSGAEAARMI